jgi:hypothetical protein
MTCDRIEVIARMAMDAKAQGRFLGGKETTWVCGVPDFRVFYFEK